VQFCLLPTIGKGQQGQQVQSLTVHEQQLTELVVFLTAVGFFGHGAKSEYQVLF
jgi:hypothetical protein